MFYVNLPLRYIHGDARYLELFQKYRGGALQQGGQSFGLELGMDAFSLQHLPRTWHEALAAQLRESGARLAMHLPFQDLSPGSGDELIRQASQARLESAFELARVYAPDHMVGHPLYHAEAWEGQHEKWVERSLATWGALIKGWPEHPPLFLENIREAGPEPLVALMQAFAAEDNVGVCFDVGHWHSFSHGGALGNLDAWISALGPWIRHLHLHDNDGSGDQHLGMGKGDIDFGHFFALLAQSGARPSATFEPHSEEAFAQSLAFFQGHPSLFAGLAGKD